MPTLFGHGVFGLAVATTFRRDSWSTGLFLLGAAAAVLPDLDGLGWRLGIPYEHWLGHRGFSHSLLFALLFSAAAAWIFSRRRTQTVSSGALFWFLLVGCGSHGLFDALTDGGLGVAFFAPFDNARIFFPWQPIPVAPLSPRRLLTARGLTVLVSELGWVGLPSLALTLAALVWRRSPAGGRGHSAGDAGTHSSGGC